MIWAALGDRSSLIRRLVFGLSASGSFAASTMMPGTALAQEQLPEIRVIARTPVPAARPTARTTRRVPSGPPIPAAPTSPPPLPRDPALIDRDKVPSNIETLTPQDFEPWKALSVPDALMRRVPSVFTNDTAVNPFQPDISYRGFLASPTVGTPQGLAIYQNGVRINEAFGDTVNWDFIPERVIHRLDVHPSNPIFGLNALGGAISIEMKNGFTYAGREAEGVIGSFGRRGVAAQVGGQRDNVAAYIAADALNDNGWRQRSASELRRLYADIGMRGDGAEFHLNFTGASNRFGAAASTPIQLLNRDWSAIFTTPQSYRNQLTFFNGTGSVRPSDTWSIRCLVMLPSRGKQSVAAPSAAIAWA
jgi:iron complex outermembrane recepter protein